MCLSVNANVVVIVISETAKAAKFVLEGCVPSVSTVA